MFDRPSTPLHFGGMNHSPGFLALVNDAKQRVTEITVAEARARLAAKPQVVLLDVREDNE